MGIKKDSPLGVVYKPRAESPFRHYTNKQSQKNQAFKKQSI
jgi:hypothetical protein